MHNPVFEHSDTFSFALLACIILYINGTQFRSSIFTFFQYILIYFASYSLLNMYLLLQLILYMFQDFSSFR